MTAEQEVSALALSTDHDIIIVDPEREYGELVRALGGGEVICFHTVSLLIFLLAVFIA